MERDILPKISVITVTKRHGGIDVAYNSLRKQTFKDFEWILVDELYDERKDEVAEYVKDIKIKHIKPRPKEEGHVWNLAHAYNDGFKQCEGELVVGYDDFIWLKGNALELFWEDYQAHPEAIFTGTGHKAPAPATVNPEGKITIFEKPYTQIPVGIKEADTRIDGNQDLIEVNHTYWELAWSAIPRKVLYDLGGFDEEADRHYCGQDRNFGLRVFLSNRKVFLDKRNENIGLHHQTFDPRPSDWETKHYKMTGWSTQSVINNERPVRLNYL